MMPKRKMSFSSKRRRAFTLIEIMVATVIMVIMVGLVIQITTQVLNVWNRSAGKLSANAEARIALDILTSDLETAVFRNNGLQWLRAEKSTDGPSSGDTVALRLFAPALDRPATSPGDICAIAYQLDNRDPVSGTTAGGTPDDRLWILYRMLEDPEDTFNDLLGEGNQNSLPGKNGNTSYASWPDFYDGGNNYLARNVVEFDIDFHVYDDGVSATPTMVSGDIVFGGDGATVGSSYTGAQSHYRQPLAYADIKLTIISDEGAALLQNIASISESEDDIIRQHGQVFTRRVYFQAQPL